MNAQVISEIRNLTADELDEVVGASNTATISQDGRTAASLMLTSR